MVDGSRGPEALKPAPKEALLEWKVSPRLNRTGVGGAGPTIIEPLDAPGANHTFPPALPE